MSYAIVRAAGKQHRVALGAKLVLDRLAADVGEEIVLDEVLLRANGEAIEVGQPLLDGHKVVAKVLQHGRGEKIRVFKRKKRKGFHKTIGHRQELTAIEITSLGE